MSGAGCRLCAASPSAAPARSLHFLARGSCAVAAQPQPSPVPHSDHGAPPPPGETTRLLTYYISSVLMPRHSVYLYLYLQPGPGPVVGRCTEALSRPAQVSVDVSSGGGPRVAQEAHTGTQVQAVSWSWHSVSRQPRHQTVAHSNTVTLLHPAYLPQVQLDTRPLHPPPLSISGVTMVVHGMYDTGTRNNIFVSRFLIYRV